MQVLKEENLKANGFLRTERDLRHNRASVTDSRPFQKVGFEEDRRRRTGREAGRTDKEGNCPQNLKNGA